MKRILTALFIAAFSVLLLSNPGPVAAADVPKVMTLVWISPEAVNDETKTRNMINDALVQKLQRYPVAVVPAETSQEIFDEYIMENDLVPLDNASMRGFSPKKAYLKEMAAQADADYVLLINTRITNKTAKAAWLSWTGFKYEVTTLFNVLLYSVSEDKYLVNDKVSVKENAAGSSSTERAFDKSCETFIKKHLDLDHLPL